MTKVEWSPDNNHLILVDSKNNVLLFNSEGVQLQDVEIEIAPKRFVGDARDEIVGLSWYNRHRAGRFCQLSTTEKRAANVRDVGAPTVAVAVRSGTIQISSGIEKSAFASQVHNAGIEISDIEWDPTGTVLAVCGCRNLVGKANGLDPFLDSTKNAAEAKGDQVTGCLLFFDTSFRKLGELSVPGGGSVDSICWHGSSLKLGIIVKSSIFFANIRYYGDYRYGIIGADASHTCRMLAIPKFLSDSSLKKALCRAECYPTSRLYSLDTGFSDKLLGYVSVRSHQRFILIAA